jgi:lysophospholipase L1-like esterase
MRLLSPSIALTLAFGFGAWMMASPSPKKTTPKKASTTRKTSAKRPVARRASAKRLTPAQQARIAQARTVAHEEIEERLRANSVVEGATALVPFFEQLRRLENNEWTGPLRLIQFGDSHTAADEWTNTLRAAFQLRFGDGGAGFVSAGRATYRRLDLRTTNSAGWQLQGNMSQSSDGRHGMAGASLTAQRPGEVVTLTPASKQFEVQFLRQPGGGGITLFADGQPLQTISTDGPEGWAFAEQTIGEASRVDLETSDQAPVRLFGFVSEKGRGVTYDQLGINGAQANIFEAWDANLWMPQLSRRAPALILLAYGTNDAGNREHTFASYKTMLAGVLAKLRQAAPAASILVLGPPDRMMRSRYTMAPYPRLEMIAQAQREAALENGCAFWDLRERMGGAGAMRRWVTAGAAQGDYVHFTPAGYRLIGATLFNDLMEQYATYQKVRERVFTATDNGKTEENLKDRADGSQAQRFP